ncbi:MAG: glycosyltransferase [Oculatellaceae cyanobacterium Prado106]|nr:glycosyltransferase [Oculatellaceae cyanobacterium Prado106]
MPGLPLPSERTHVINQGGLAGKLEEYRFKLSGFSPQLSQQIRQIRPAIIHAQFGLSGVLILPLARSLNIPLIVHFRGADATLTEDSARYLSLNHWLYFQRRPALQQQARLFLTVSQFIRQKLLEQGFPGDRVITHYHGVDTTQFCPDPNVPREPVVLFVGRLTAKKGCLDMIQAMAQIQRTKPDIRLVMIGDGPLRERLELAAAQTLKNYQFLGTQSSAVVKDWMNRAQVLMAPSVTSAEGDAEGLPNVVMEAQAMGLPVVATLHAGIPEAVIQGETGFLVPEHDPEGLAAYSLRLLGERSLWEHMSIRGREHMQTHFERATQTRTLERIYASVMDA